MSAGMLQEPVGAGRRIGYARVSTANQHLDIQLEALQLAGCDQVFTDHGVSGAKASRPGLDDALAALSPGDTLVVFKLDRLGRSVLHLSDLLTRFGAEGIHFWSWIEGINTGTAGGKLVYHIFSAIAEFQRELIRENTVQGIQAARARGKQIGRPFALNEMEILEAHRQIKQKNVPIGEAAHRSGVSHSTLTRAVKRLGLEL